MLEIAWTVLKIAICVWVVGVVLIHLSDWFIVDKHLRTTVHDAKIAIEMNPETEPGVFTPIDPVDLTTDKLFYFVVSTEKPVSHDSMRLEKLQERHANPKKVDDQS